MTTPTDAPTGLRVTDRVLQQYRHLQDRHLHPHLDKLGHDPVADRLRSQIFQQLSLYPWTPSEVVNWSFAWLHQLAFGAEAKMKRPFQPYPSSRRSVAWCLDYPDIKVIIEELSEDDRQRCEQIS